MLVGSKTRAAGTTDLPTNFNSTCPTQTDTPTKLLLREEKQQLEELLNAQAEVWVRTKYTYSTTHPAVAAAVVWDFGLMILAFNDAVKTLATHESDSTRRHETARLLRTEDYAYKA